MNGVVEAYRGRVGSFGGCARERERGCVSTCMRTGVAIAASYLESGVA